MNLPEELKDIDGIDKHLKMANLFKAVVEDCFAVQGKVANGANVKEEVEKCGVKAVAALMEYNRIFEDEVSPHEMGVKEDATGIEVPLKGSVFTVPLCVIEVMGNIGAKIIEEANPGTTVGLFVPNPGQEHVDNGIVNREWPIFVNNEIRGAIPAGLIAQTIIVQMVGNAKMAMRFKQECDEPLSTSLARKNGTSAPTSSQMDIGHGRTMTMKAGTTNRDEVDELFEKAFGNNAVMAFNPKNGTKH